MATEWDVAIGETMPRRTLHERWGGGWYGGMEPSVKANSVFLFSKPSAGQRFGYTYDGWQPDGTFHYTGDGQVGDQSEGEGGNRALLAAPNIGRVIRLFRSEGTNTTYIGEFDLADPPFEKATALDRVRTLRSVLVFRLVPRGEVLRDHADDAPPDGPEEIPLEANDVKSYVKGPAGDPPEVLRREAALVARYQAWLARRGQEAVRHRIRVPGGGGNLYTDVYVKPAEELIEAKASAARPYVRSGLGQILDYSRFVSHNTRALLLASRPSDDLLELLAAHDVHAIWPVGSEFSRA